MVRARADTLAERIKNESTVHRILLPEQLAEVPGAGCLFEQAPFYKHGAGNESCYG